MCKKVTTVMDAAATAVGTAAATDTIPAGVPFLPTESYEATVNRSVSINYVKMKSHMKIYIFVLCLRTNKKQTRLACSG